MVSPTNEAENEVKDDWYGQLQYEVFRVRQYDLLLIIGDINAKFGDLGNCDNWRK